MWGGEVGRGRDPEKCLCLSAEKPASLHSLLSLSLCLSPPALILTVYSPPAALLPASDRALFSKTLICFGWWLALPKAFLRQTTFFPFSKSCGGKLLSEVAPALTRQNACKLGDWRPKVSFKSFFFVCFFCFFYAFSDSTKRCKWMSAVCVWQDACSVLMCFFHLLVLPLYFGGACESHLWLSFLARTVGSVSKTRKSKWK